MGQQPQSRQADRGIEIERLVGALGNPNYRTRMKATRQLCAIGSDAYDALWTAANGDNVEVSLRAQAILNAFDRLWFDGVKIELAFSKGSISWDEPVELQIKLHNASRRPAKLPFVLDLNHRHATGRDARQVADMLDAAEWLTVVGPSGHEVALRVDDITADEGVLHEVHSRLDVGPVSRLPPGDTATLTVAFNRGWARYPLLDRGTHSAVLEYMPEWEDRELTAAGVGRVISNTVSLRVHTPAPATISRSGIEATIELAIDNGVAVARLVNRVDQVVHVNTNFSAATPFAQARWVYESVTDQRDLPIRGRTGATWRDFDPALLVPVQPGGTVELARADLKQLRGQLIQVAAGRDDVDWSLHFSYSNLCDRQWQAKERSALQSDSKTPPILKNPLPRRILTGWHQSNRLIDPR